MTTRPAYLLLLLVVAHTLMCGNDVDGSKPADQHAAGSADSYFATGIRSSEFLFLGELIRVHESDCALSGLAMSRQGLTFKVVEVLSGQAPSKEFRVDAVIVKNGWLQVYEAGCHQMAPGVFRPGARFLVACKRVQELRDSDGWVIVGGPWADDPQTRDRIQDIKNAGPYSEAQVVWKMHEDVLRTVARGGAMADNEVRAALKFFERTTGLSYPSDGAQRVRAEEVREYLAQLDAWYREKGPTLRVDPRELRVVPGDGV